MQEHVQIFGEELATVGKKFHDVVHEIVQEVISNRVVFQGIRIAMFLGTPIVLITWIILAYYSSLFFAAVNRSTKQRRKTRGERRAQAVNRKQC